MQLTLIDGKTRYFSSGQMQQDTIRLEEVKGMACTGFVYWETCYDGPRYYVKEGPRLINAMIALEAAKSGGQ